MKGGAPQLKPEDAELLKAFAAMQGLQSADLIHLAMTALVAQIRVQLPHCARCPLMQAHKGVPLPDNVILGKFN